MKALKHQAKQRLGPSQGTETGRVELLGGISKRLEKIGISRELWREWLLQRHAGHE